MDDTQTNQPWRHTLEFEFDLLYHFISIHLFIHEGHTDSLQRLERTHYC